MRLNFGWCVELKGCAQNFKILKFLIESCLFVKFSPCQILLFHFLFASTPSAKPATTKMLLSFLPPPAINAPVILTRYITHTQTGLTTHLQTITKRLIVHTIATPYLLMTRPEVACQGQSNPKLIFFYRVKRDESTLLWKCHKNPQEHENTGGRRLSPKSLFLIRLCIFKSQLINSVLAFNTLVLLLIHYSYCICQF